MPAVERLELGHQRARHLRAVAVEHPGVVGIEQRVLDAGEAGALAPLDDDRVARPVDVALLLASLAVAALAAR